MHVDLKALYYIIFHIQNKNYAHIIVSISKLIFKNPLNNTSLLISLISNIATSCDFTT